MSYNWTVKRQAALEYLISAKGNVSEAARLGAAGEVAVSYGYLNVLANAPGHKPFRDEYERRTGEMLSDLGVTSEYIVSGIKDEAEACKHDATRLRAKELLGKWRGLFKERKELEFKGGFDVRLGTISDAELESIIDFTKGGIRREGEEAGEATNP